MAGNATMTHLVLGIDPEPLGMAPFIMSTRLFPEVLAADLGLAGAVHPRSRAVVFPAFGAYVGGDITAGLLASGMDRDARVRLFVDIGTNCEIVLGNREWLLATAAPGRARVRGRRDQVRDAGRRRRHRGRHHDPRRTEPQGDRRRRTAGPVRLRPGGRGDRPGPAGPARLLGPVHPRGGGRGHGARAGRPADPDRPGAGVRAALAGTQEVRARRTASTCPSATSASCSSPRRRSRPAGRSCSRRPG